MPPTAIPMPLVVADTGAAVSPFRDCTDVNVGNGGGADLGGKVRDKQSV